MLKLCVFKFSIVATVVSSGFVASEFSGTWRIYGNMGLLLGFH